jgi:hypothetical protein
MTRFNLEFERRKTAEQPAAGKAGIASLLAIGHHWPGASERGRSADICTRYDNVTIL